MKDGLRGFGKKRVGLKMREIFVMYLREFSLSYIELQK
jgi:hypothetical protein